MNLLAWTLFLSLTLLGIFAGIVLAQFFNSRSRAENAIVGLLVFWGIIVGPISLLGYLNFLYPGSVAVLSAVASVGVLVVAARRSSPLIVAKKITRSLLNSFAMPAESIKESWQSGSLSAVGIIAAFGAVAFTLMLSYLVPADESWDGLYYHQPIVGFALQNHGFSFVNLPTTLLAQTINGYPKFGEMFSLWFVLFTDKTLIEAGNSLAALGMMLAIYALVRRYSVDRVACIGWSSVILLMPAMYSQLRTTMVDIQLWFFYLSAVYFVTKPMPRARDILVGFVASAFVLGTKGTGLVLVPLLVAIGCIRQTPLSSGRSRAACICAGLALITAVVVLTSGRNFLAYGNPFWPISYTSRWLGVSFPGVATIQQLSPDPDMIQLLAREYEHPSGGVHDIIVRSYGNAVSWVVAPLGIASFLIALTTAVRGVVRRARDDLADNLLLVGIATLSPLLLSPSFANARYNVQAVVLAILAIAWLADKSGRPRLQDGAVAAAIVLSLMSAVWSDYLWGLGLSWRDIAALVRHAKIERRSMNFSKVQMPPEVAIRREAELGSGDVASFTDELTFIGVLWNDEFSNRVIYIPWTESASFLEQLEHTHTRWIAVGGRSAARRALEHSGRYELVGTATQQDNTVIFRRRTDG
jgi:hypothetical protein